MLISLSAISYDLNITDSGNSYFRLSSRKPFITSTAKQIIPAVVHYTRELAETILAVREAGASTVVQEGLLKECSRLLEQTSEALEKLREAEKQAPLTEEGRERAEYYYRSVVPAMEALRKPVDELEMIVDKACWPMPSYGDLLFEV